MSKQEQNIQRYLLGELTEAEQTTLEQQYFNDRSLFEEVVLVENELVDKYARGLLAPATRDRFEKHYLDHPRRRERARFAEALATRIDEKKTASISPSASASWFDRLLGSQRGPRLAWALSAVILLVAAAAVWFFLESRRLERQLATIESERITREKREGELQQEAANERLRAEKLSQELDQLRTTPNGSSGSPTEEKKPALFATLVLAIGGTRGADAGSPALLVIPTGTEQVRLQLRLRENNYSSYQIVVQSAGGDAVFTSRRVGAANGRPGANLTFNAPARAFTAGDYILTLRGATKTGEVEDVSKSLFRVERK